MYLVPCILISKYKNQISTRHSFGTLKKNLYSFRPFSSMQTMTFTASSCLFSLTNWRTSLRHRSEALHSFPEDPNGARPECSGAGCDLLVTTVSSVLISLLLRSVLSSRVYDWHRLMLMSVCRLCACG